MTQGVAAAQLRQWLADGTELALVDVREHGQFGEGHPFFAVPLPYSRLELDAPRLLPRRAARVVLCGDASSGLAERAAARLAALGYEDLHVLAGGTEGWAAAGFPLFKGVNVPSKTFGEWVEHHLHTPRIGAHELARRRAAGEPIVVLDGRTFAEFRKMSIPGAICCPNGELALRIADLAADPATTVVVNCAGRTRSIIGTQTLIDVGVPNPVLALENGTQGWYLDDLGLEHGRSERHAIELNGADYGDARVRAQALAARHGVRLLDTAEAQAIVDDATRTHYVFDVRTAEEYAARTLPGARHAPGGQLIQATDQYVGVRHARILLADSDGIRAPVVASWLRRMGHAADVLRAGIAAPLRIPAPWPALARALLPAIDALALAAELAAGRAALFDLRPSSAFRAAHARGAHWSIRPRLAEAARRAGLPVALVADEPALAEIAALDLIEAGLAAPRVLAGGFAAWTAAGLPVEASPQTPGDAEAIDFLFFVHDRHDGNKAAARAYLAWETGLIAQCTQDELAAFRL